MPPLLHWMLLVFAALMACKEVCCADVNYTTVFSHGEGGWPCIRIPAITRCGEGLLHAFAECRTRTGDGCVPTTKPSKSAVTAGICYKNSTDDGGTWSTIIQIVSDASQPTVVCTADNNLLLQYNMGTVNKAVISKDSGGTWGPSFTVDLGNNDWAYVGPGRGLVLTSEKSPAPGRILFIGHHSAYEYDLVWYSDDGGQTYTLSETKLTKMDEAQLVELNDGQILANMRNDHLTSCDCRGLSISSDGGKTFSNITYDPTLISPVCMASIISTENGSLIFANPASKTSRINGTVRRSDDGGKSWMGSWSVTAGDYAYSCLTHVTRQDQVGLLWETSAKDCSGPSCQLVFSKITVF